MSGRRRAKGRAVSGIVILDKPKGLSSNAALQRVKRLYNANKAGHTGSLDPLATGVLPLCLGEATKVSQFLLDSDKKYRATIRLGVKTDTGDAEGQVIETAADGVVSAIDSRSVRKQLETFRGDIMQMPPMYSALKVNGVPLYKLARSGQEVERQARAITVYGIELVEHAADEVTIEVHCSKGTYIRTIADDLGRLLGCGAHITALRRLQAGCFDEEHCVTLEQLEALVDTVTESGEQSDERFAAIDELLMPADQAIDFLPEVVLPNVMADCIKQGQAVQARNLPADGLVRMYDEDRFFGIGHIDDDGRVAPKRLLN